LIAAGRCRGVVDQLDESSKILFFDHVMDLATDPILNLFDSTTILLQRGASESNCRLRVNASCLMKRKIRR
jgi:hypothetical protein